jgi:uncharacterized membrane protein required for colicin V production
MNLDKIPFGWIDLVTVVVLFVGILRGRKRGLSEELLDTLQWITIVVVAGMFYRDVAECLGPPSLVGQTFYNITGYLIIVVTIKLVVSFLKKHMGSKLVGADIFGRFEYYLGMLAGMVRFACMYFVAASILHAPYYTEQMLAEDAKSQQKNFGDIRFPTLGGIQHSFFTESATGWAAHTYLGNGLVQPVESQVAQLRGEGSLGRKRERAVDAVMGGK